MKELKELQDAQKNVCSSDPSLQVNQREPFQHQVTPPRPNQLSRVKCDEQTYCQHYSWQTYCWSTRQRLVVGRTSSLRTKRSAP